MKGLQRQTHFQWRFAILKIFFFFFGAVIIGRLFSLQIIKHQEYLTLAERQQGASLTLPSKRGVIYWQDKDGVKTAAALNKEWPAVAVIPKSVSEPTTAIEILSSILQISTSTAAAFFEKKDDPFEIVARKIAPEKINALRTAIQATGIEGIKIFSEFRRFYPGENLGAHILGFVNFENDTETGQYGIERWYNDKLSGRSGLVASIKDARGNLLFLGRKIIKPRENGDSLTLTIDQNIQKIAEEEIAKVAKKWSAQSAAFLILDPMTGKIMAMGSYPSFDPNAYSKEKDIGVFKNPIVDSQFELGSIVKPITMAAGIEEKVVTPTTPYTDTGDVLIDGYHIRNFDLKAHGVQTMTQVLEKSLNTGAMFVEGLLGKDRFLSYLQKFGFGEKTGIAFPNEARGNISNLLQNRDIDYATASFGQGIAITPLQISYAIAALANGGMLAEPYLVETIEDDSGNRQTFEPNMKRRVISAETSETITRMLVSAVQNGFENHAGVPGYFVAGKTGTAQVPYKDRRGYDPNRAIHSFVGYAPAFRPKFLIFLQLNEPKGVRFASSSLTPAFHAIAKYMLNYYQIPFDYDPTLKPPAMKQ